MYRYCFNRRPQKAEIYFLALLLTLQLVIFSGIGRAYGAGSITSYISLDLKASKGNYDNEISGKSILSFRYLINDTFQFLVMVDTNDAQMPKALLKFYPGTEYKVSKQDFLYNISLPSSYLNTNLNPSKDTPCLIDKLDIAEIIPGFKGITKIGFRGIDCYIGDIRLLDKNSIEPPYSVYIDPNVHILYQPGWASNDSADLFEIEIRQNWTNDFIHIKGQNVVDPDPKSNASGTTQNYYYTGWPVFGGYPSGYTYAGYPGVTYPASSVSAHATGIGYYGGYAGYPYSGYYGGLGLYGLYGGIGLYGGFGGQYGGLYGY
ncbi:hypothetical protein JXL19_00800, partial [bacterium]|nr:hypothetical protein [bacterium]